MYIFSFIASVQDAMEARDYYNNKLGISQRTLEGGAVEWETIVQKIMNLQESGEHRVAIHGQKFDCLIVAQRILRKENFMIAFFKLIRELFRRVWKYPGY